MQHQDFLASLLEDPLNGDPQDWEALYEHETGDKSLNNLNTEELQVLLLWQVEAGARAWAEAEAWAGAGAGSWAGAEAWAGAGAWARGRTGGG